MDSPPREPSMGHTIAKMDIWKIEKYIPEHIWMSKSPYFLHSPEQSTAQSLEKINWGLGVRGDCLLTNL